MALAVELVATVTARGLVQNANLGGRLVIVRIRTERKTIVF